jgi:2-dehydropantoate 2-reductase
LEKLNILTFGAGAIGTYIGGSLALAGHRVVFIEHPSFTEELCRHGLRIEVPKSKKQKTQKTGIFSVPASSFSCVSSLQEALEQGPFDAAVFALKSFDTAAALEGIKPYKHRMPPILCLQNGVDNEPAIQAALGPDSVIAGTVTSAIGRRAAGDIVLEKSRGVGIAATPGSANRALAERLVAALKEAGLDTRLFPDPADMKWSKMLGNLPASVTVAIVDMTPAEVYAHPGLFELEMHMSQEALAVMKAQGIHAVNLPRMPIGLLSFATSLPVGIARPLLKKFVGGGRGGKMPGFHIDLHAGRKLSEVEWLHGAVVRYGEKVGVPTPVNRVLVQTLLAMVRGEIPIEEFSKKPEKLIQKVRSENWYER